MKIGYLDIGRRQRAGRIESELFQSTIGVEFESVFTVDDRYIENGLYNKSANSSGIKSVVRRFLIRMRRRGRYLWSVRVNLVKKLVFSMVKLVKQALTFLKLALKRVLRIVNIVLTYIVETLFMLFIQVWKRYHKGGVDENSVSGDLNVLSKIRNIFAKQKNMLVDVASWMIVRIRSISVLEALEKDGFIQILVSDEYSLYAATKLKPLAIEFTLSDSLLEMETDNRFPNWYTKLRQSFLRRLKRKLVE